MNDLAANTPVIIGVGFSQEKLDDAQASSEACQLMVKAVEDAVQDTGNAEIARQIQSITVLKGMWEYKNPGKLIADQLGCESAKSILADVGNLQLGALFDVCNAISDGELDIGVVVGGEAKYRELRAKIAGEEVTSTVQGEDDPEPDLYVGIPDPFATDTEVAAGIFMPVELFSVIESAIRADRGWSMEEHRDNIAQLYSRFSEIASQNPRAWKQEVVAADDIRNPTDKNAMLAFPYTKKFNSQWNVNQAAALLVCSAGKAKELGLDNSNWIYPLAGAQNRHVVCLAQKQQLHSQPGAVIAGKKAYELAGIQPQDVNKAELYSCFPAPVQTYARDLELEDVCEWSVSGCMAFAGGPYNHASIDSVVRMADVLREAPQDEQTMGLVSNLSGIFGKHAVTILSNQPGANGYGFADVTEEVAKVDEPLATTLDYTGAATIAGYTVAHIANEPSHAFVYCDTPEGRTVVKTMDKDLLQQMMTEEFVGREVDIQEDRTFTC